MGYERSKFGDDVLTGSGGNVKSKVSNHYGPRDTGKTNGLTNSDGFMREISLDLDATVVGNGEFALTVVPKLPAGSRVEDVFVEVEEAFALGGTSPTILVGTSGLEATNGVAVTEAQAEAVGVYDVTSALAGTWAAATGFTSEVEIGVALGGTSPTVTTAGKARLVIRYFHS